MRVEAFWQLLENATWVVRVPGEPARLYHYDLSGVTLLAESEAAEDGARLYGVRYALGGVAP